MLRSRGSRNIPVPSGDDKNSTRTISSCGTLTDEPKSPSNAPPEIWQEVFAYLSGPELKSLALVCSGFRHLAQMALFRVFVVHPIRLSEPLNYTNGELLYETHRVSSTLESQRLAAYIEQIHMVPRITKSFFSQTRLHLPKSDRLAERHLDPVFEALPELPRLQDLACTHITISLERWRILRSLRIRSIRLQDVSLIGMEGLEEIVSPPQFSELTLTRSRSSRPLIVNQAQDRQMIKDALRSPNLFSFTTSLSESISKLLAHNGPLTSLTLLEIPTNCLGSSLFLDAMSLCRSLRKISLSLAIGDTRLPPPFHIPANILPHLIAYTGPRMYASSFNEGRSLREIQFTLSCKAHDLPDTLKDLRSSALLAFRAKILFLQPSAFGAVSEHLPELRELSFRSVESCNRAQLSKILESFQPHVNIKNLELDIAPPLLSWRETKENFLKLGNVCVGLLRVKFPAVTRVELHLTPSSKSKYGHLIWTRLGVGNQGDYTFAHPEARFKNAW